MITSLKMSIPLSSEPGTTMFSVRTILSAASSPVAAMALESSSYVATSTVLVVAASLSSTTAGIAARTTNATASTATAARSFLEALAPPPWRGSFSFSCVLPPGSHPGYSHSAPHPSPDRYCFVLFRRYPLPILTPRVPSLGLCAKKPRESAIRNPRSSYVLAIQHLYLCPQFQLDYTSK